ncbi:hypothetical protein ACQPW3_29625 [Actinosynnema sp. CA-248983]
MSEFTNYEPQGESLTFTRPFTSDPESSEVFFTDALRVRDHLAGVVRPSGIDLWFACAIDGTFISVDDPEPSEPYWELLRQDTPASTIYPPSGPPATTRRLPELSDEALLTTYRQALNVVTCPPGFFVMFERIAPTGLVTRVVDTGEIAGRDAIPVKLWDDTLELATTTEGDGTTWLASPSETSPYLPPVTFNIHFESILALTLSVNWTRWLEKGTGEHELVQSALNALLADEWRPESRARHFTL